MPFWKERKQKNGKRTAASIISEDDGSDEAFVDANVGEENPSDALSDCALCQRPIGDGRVTCNICSKEFHDICIELEMDDSDEEVEFYTDSW